MRIIDLSQTIESDMSVYPGDPPVKITPLHSLEKEGWRLKNLSFGSHTGTHVDAPAHMDRDGKTLDQLPLERFFGKAYVVTNTMEDFRKNIGLIFREGTIDVDLFERILEAAPPFVVTGDAAVLTVEMERKLLHADIITFTDLINLSQLPTDTEFSFFGIPLKIKDGDGSPVRAFAMVDD